MFSKGAMCTGNSAVAQDWEGSTFIMFVPGGGEFLAAKWHMTRAGTFGLETQTLVTLLVGTKVYHPTSSEDPSLCVMAETNQSQRTCGW